MNSDPSRADSGGEADPNRQPVASFERAAARYNRFSEVQRAMADWTAEWLPATETAGAIREMAAGTGHLTRHLAKRSGDVIASDASPGMVKTGQQILSEIGWRISGADDVPNPPANWILSSSFLQWASEPNRLFRNWLRALGPDGRVLSGLFIRPTLIELEELRPDAIPLSWKSAEEWRMILRESGFDLVRDEAVSREVHFSTALDFFRSLHYIGAAPHRRLRATEMRELLRVYGERFASSEGVRSTWTFYRFEAKRSPDE